MTFSESWQEAYVEMLANPFDGRSNTEFCRDAGISPSTFYKWLRVSRSEAGAEATARRRKYFDELRAANYRAIVANLKRSFNDRKLLAQLLGDLVERSEVRTETLTPDQKRDKLARLLDTLAPGPAPTKEA